MALVLDSTLELMKEVQMGNGRRVKAMLAAGANVDGSLQLRPLLWAASAGDITMVKLLIEHGANVNALARNAVKHTTAHLVLNGERALHLAVVCDHIHVIRELLRAGADPNAVCHGGATPLLVACTSVRKGRWVEIIRELLEAGADPTLADDQGRNVLHHTISEGKVELIAMLISKVPRSLLSVEDGEGRTPLYLTAEKGDERRLSCLLWAGARQSKCEVRRCCPLIVSIAQGHEGVVRLLTTKEGMEALGGSSTVLPQALCCAANFGRRRILRLVLAADGEDKERFWARNRTDRRSLLHFAAAYGKLVSVRVLLAAGADVAATDLNGRLPREVVGDAADVSDKETLDRSKKEFASIRQELERGPAYSARSWAWPVQGVVNPAAGHDGAVVKPVTIIAAARKAPVLGLRVLRRRKSNAFFVKLVGRHAQKV